MRIALRREESRQSSRGARRSLTQYRLKGRPGAESPGLRVTGRGVAGGQGPRRPHEPRTPLRPKLPGYLFAHLPASPLPFFLLPVAPMCIPLAPRLLSAPLCAPSLPALVGVGELGAGSTACRSFAPARSLLRVAGGGAGGYGRRCGTRRVNGGRLCLDPGTSSMCPCRPQAAPGWGAAPCPERWLSLSLACLPVSHREELGVILPT